MRLRCWAGATLRALFITLVSVPAWGTSAARDLQTEVKDGARDSIRYGLAQQTVYLCGAAKVKFEDV